MTFFIKIWLPLTKVDNKNGSMIVYKSSNKLGFIEPKYKNKKSTYPEIKHKFTGGFKEIVFDLEPGDCVIFNPFILHGNINFTSSMARIACSIRFQGIKKPLMQKNTDYYKYYKVD